jgi:hypothetical protein
MIPGATPQLISLEGHGEEFKGDGGVPEQASSYSAALFLQPFLFSPTSPNLSFL